MGSSTEPYAQVVHTVVAARRLAGWALWAQLSMLARLVTAWHTCPPVSNEIGIEDRCEDADAGLAERLNVEIGRLQRAVSGRLGVDWPGMAAEMAPMLVSAEVALACGFSRTGADRLLDAVEALFLQGRLPRLRRLLRQGWVDWTKLDWFVRDTAHLDPFVADAVERLVLGDLPPEVDAGACAGSGEPGEFVDVPADPARPGSGLPGIVTMTVPQLRAAIAAAIAAIDAVAAERAARRAREARRVRCQANSDGTATLTADLAVEAAAAVWNALTAAARAAKAAGDPRSLDQLRADELLARTAGAPLPAPDLGGEADDDGQGTTGTPDGDPGAGVDRGGEESSADAADRGDGTGADGSGAAGARRLRRRDH